MDSFYFGTSEKPLFGLYHPPNGRKESNSGIVLCNPFGHESIIAYRAFRQLAIHLSRSGFHVLRFDYFGCGDSAGDSDKGNLQQWLEDISAAIDEIKDIAGVHSVSLIGLRLGGALCALIGNRREDLQSLVLWNPVINGKDYIEEITGLQDFWLSGQLLTQKSSPNGLYAFEILGFPLTDGLCDDLENLNVLHLPKCNFPQILFVENTENSDYAVFKDHMQSLGAFPEYQYIPDQKIWEKHSGMNEALVPMQTLQCIVRWLIKVNA